MADNPFAGLFESKTEPNPFSGLFTRPITKPAAPDDEDAFRAWYTPLAAKWQLDPNPDAPEHKYDYRAAYRAGATPDETGHWPSEFKAPDHPNRYVDGVDTITGEPADDKEGAREIVERWKAEGGAAPAAKPERAAGPADYVDRLGTSILSNVSAPVDLAQMAASVAGYAPNATARGLAALATPALQGAQEGLAAVEGATELPFTTEGQERHRQRFRELSHEVGGPGDPAGRSTRSAATPVEEALMDTLLEGGGAFIDPLAAGAVALKALRPAAKAGRAAERLAAPAAREAVQQAAGAPVAPELAARVAEAPPPAAVIASPEQQIPLQEPTPATAGEVVPTASAPRATPAPVGVPPVEATTTRAAAEADFLPSQQAGDVPAVTPKETADALQEAAPEAQAAPSPAPVLGDELPPTGIKNAVTTAERAERGLPEVEVGAAQRRGGDDAVLQAGKDAVDRGDIDPRLLARNLAEKPRAITAEETSALLYDRARIRNAHREALDEADTAFAAGDQERALAAKQRALDIEDDLAANDEAGRVTGYEWGVAGRARQMMMEPDYSAADVMQRARVAQNGRPVEGPGRDTLLGLTKELEATRAALAQAQEEAAQRAAEALVAREAKVAHRQAARGTRRAKRAVTRQQLDTEFADLSKQFRAAMGTPRAGLDPELVGLMGQMARNRIHAGITNAAEVVDAVWQVAREHIEGITVREVRDAISGYGREPQVTRSELAGALREAKRQLVLTSKLEDVQAGMRPSTRARKPPSAAVAKLQREVQAAMRAAGFTGQVDDAARLKAFKTTKERRIAELETQIREGRFEKGPARHQLPLDREALDLRTKERLLRAQVDDEVEALRRANLTPRERLWETFKGGVGAVRTLKSTFDLSFPFRQGLGAIRYPKQYLRAFRDMHKLAFGEGAYQQMISRIEADPDYLLMRQAGLDLSAIDGAKRVTAQEENLIGARILGKVPGIRVSERAYSGMATQLRADVFKHLVAMAELAGRNPREDAKLVKDLARVVNTLTGRGDLGRFSKMGGELSTALWSPRLMASRLNMLDVRGVAGKGFYGDLDPFARRQALESLAAVGAFVGTVGTLATAAGLKVGYDPRSPDFGKVRVGENTRLDFGGGLFQYIRLGAQLATGKAISSTTGEVYDLAEGRYGRPTRLSAVYRFEEGKTNPFVSAILNWARTKTLAGDPATAKTQANALFNPLQFETAWELIQNDPQLLPLLGLSTYGVGVQSYKDRSQRDDEEDAPEEEDESLIDKLAS